MEDFVHAYVFVRERVCEFEYMCWCAQRCVSTFESVCFSPYERESVCECGLVQGKDLVK